MPQYRLHRHPLSSHQQIARMLRRLVREPILDVGAAQGILGQALQGTSLTIDAVEPNAAWAALARPHYRQVYASTVEEADLPQRTYKVVVCADVLEHLVDPTAVLRQLRRVGTDDAHFIVSLPNVAHVAVRLLLLAGRFPQMEQGIFDRTHLHFYTRDTAEAMLRCAGLEVVWARPTGVPLEELWPRGEGRALFTLVMRLQQLVLRLAPRLFGYQWVFLARPYSRHPE